MCMLIMACWQLLALSMEFDITLIRDPKNDNWDKLERTGR